jgi:hypothetical protein
MNHYSSSVLVQTCSYLIDHLDAKGDYNDENKEGGQQEK